MGSLDGAKASPTVRTTTFEVHCSVGHIFSFFELFRVYILVCLVIENLTACLVRKICGLLKI